MSQHQLYVSRAARIGIDPEEAAAAVGSRLSDSLGWMFEFKTDLTLPYLTLWRSCSCYNDRMVSIRWLVDVSYNYGILMRKCLPLRCLKNFLFPFFGFAVYEIFSERSTILTGFYICGTLESKLKIYFFSWMFLSSLLLAAGKFQQLPYVLWIRQGEVLISFMDPPLFPSFLRHLFLRTH